MLDNIGSEQTFIVALGSEYDEIINDKQKYKNKFTIFTKRHSIENYLFCAESLSQIINRLNRDCVDNICNIKEYIKKRCLSLETLLYLDCKKNILHQQRSILKWL